MQNSGKMFFLDAPGGTGKTFLINLLLAKFKMQGNIALVVASSGIAATLLQNGKTAHATFILPSDLQSQERTFCNISKQSSLAKVLKETTFIVWDESTMANKGRPEALDRTLRDFRADERPMGGVVILFAGDFWQILPVVPRSIKSDEINARLKSSFLWASVKLLRLTTNMRVHLGGDNNTAQFSRILLDMGNGNILNNDGEVLIEPTFSTSVTGQDELIANVYPQVAQNLEKTDDWLRERSILAPKNDSEN